MEFLLMIKNWHLYVITDEQLSKGRSHAEIARSAIEGGADVIQLRDKSASSRKLYEDALAMIESGATRLGASASAKIMAEAGAG